MKISKVFFKLSLLAVLIYGLSLLLTFRAPDREIIYQVSIFSALMKGDYEGEIKLKNLKKQGDLGIGTFNALDGEMIELDSKFYQVKSDGKVYLAGDSAKTPFAAVTFFDVDRRVFLNQTLDFEGLTKFIDSFIPNKNILYAIKIEGKFEYVKARSVRRQEKPYLPLLEVVKAQSTFEFTNIDGTIVGFRLPKYLEGINVPGYHLHFLSKDKKSGGHLLQCKIKSGRIDLDNSYQLNIILPKSREFSQTDLIPEDKESVRKVEQGN